MATALSSRQRDAAIWLLYVLGLVPGLWYFYLGVTAQLGADPVRTFEHALGLWALRFLCLGLAITPLRDLAGINLIAYRRALGLLAFYYVLAHFAVYLTLDRGLILTSILGDILKRPYIMLGMAGLIMLIPLALTSNRWSIRKLGPRWTTLHKLAYPIPLVAVLHYVLSIKSITLEPVFYLAVVTLLLGYRLVRPYLMERKRARKKAAATVAAPSGSKA
ncbi:protein-methionine-sulfoxide reductase heme-binding subunit MsrQ [Rhizobium sp. RU36D]|uniref:protein-methionine-sulfoxide reductase heme-binding subunit MsrQ n=1 Tax=Rhizobium sp. RU36D TaxID=1907415 RepID=UPI0009D84F7C|nr:protein-methionine-sulfoxide reductase heme-binding subunit MsrQ [Rhizobium sp. RU36D]SMD20078.1 sulfoxide reductase heme-binding subunit YedZ [Rhizobium sp. RU36D]